MARALGQAVKRQLKGVTIAFPAVLVVAGLVCVLVDAVFMGIGLFTGAIVFPLLLTWMIRASAKRQLAYLCVPTTLRVTTDAYEYRTEHSNTTMRWSMFGDIVVGPEFWLFYVKKQCVGFLPRSAFDSDQRAELDAFIAARQRA
ncbi:YcxB family protein [Nonomuraea africana]|uniref:YcxB-like C-terminal domain-containing protein n=1 Tax=Nonomuraea africana TaxID=46171 RepID=A0ABR9KR67_9ACTN|nr:hypothetical protein [Nonomuraea africana]